jgi:hypothetical protein
MTKRILEWEKNIGKWVTEKRMTGKIRSVRSPLIRDGEKRLNYRSFGRSWIGIFEFGVFESWSEKGNRRKHTGNWVTRWEKMFLGEFRDLRWIAKRIWLEEFGFRLFWSFDRGSTWGLRGGGTNVVHLGDLLVALPYGVGLSPNRRGVF